MLDSFSRMTLDTLHRVWFRNDIPKDKESLLFKKVKEVFRTPWIMDILRRFPFGIYLLRILAQIMRTPRYFEKVASEILQQRRKTGPTGRQDLMHLMLTANEDSTEKGLSKLTDEEIIGQCQIFLFAGYETSSNTLAYITYQLALNQNVQDKLKRGYQGSSLEKPLKALCTTFLMTLSIWIVL